MSFMRPDLARRFQLWREPIAWAVLLVSGLWLIWQGYRSVAPLPFASGLLFATAGFGLLTSALRRLRFHACIPAEGVVTLDEGRIGYLGPYGGGFIDLADLVRVEIVTRPNNRLAPPANWILTDVTGTVLDIPFGAREAERVYDALSPLTGVDYEAAMAALEAPAPVSVCVWATDR